MQIARISPASRAQLVADGLSSSAIDNKLRSGELQVPYRGIYVPAGPVERRHLFKAALATQPQGKVAVSHRSAAVARELPWIPASWAGLNLTDLTVGVDSTTRERPGMRIRRLELPISHVTDVDGIPVTVAARTVIDLVRARDVSLVHGLQLMDGLVRFQHSTVEDLRRVANDLRGSRGIRRASRLVNLARPGVDSPQESSLRWILLEGGIAPEDIDVNIAICDADGRVLIRGDLGSRRHMIWWEYDGYETHSDRDVFGSDRARDRWLQERGWAVMRFSAADMTNREQVIMQWKRAVLRATRS